MADDFPAAHSMDSYWFAVDRDGRVAVFATGEAGAMPQQAEQGDPYDFASRVTLMVPAGLPTWTRSVPPIRPGPTVTGACLVLRTTTLRTF